MTTFRRDIESVINRNSAENGSDTPDYILARYLEACLAAFDLAVRDRDEWHGFKSADTFAVTEEPRMSLTPLHVLRYDGPEAIVVCEPTDDGAFAYPNSEDPDGVWARRVPRGEVEA